MIYLPCVFSHTLFNATFFQKQRVLLSPTFRFKALAYIFVLHFLDQRARLRHIQKGLGQNNSNTHTSLHASNWGNNNITEINTPKGVYTLVVHH